MYKLKATFTTVQGEEVFKTEYNTKEDAEKSMNMLVDSINDSINKDGVLTINTSDGVIGVNMAQIVSFRIKCTPVENDGSGEES